MIENEFLDLMVNYLANQANLSPAPFAVGVADATDVAQTPAVVLGLKKTQRLGKGLGERSTVITDGALAVSATIDLANPVLSTDPSFRLLSADRLQLILPHGGLVRADASTGPLGPADLTISVAGVSRPVVTNAPTGLQVLADPTIGTLTFATALPPAGSVVANYFLGQWEQRTERVSGVLRIAVQGADANAIRNLSNSVVNALEAPPLAGIRELQLLELGVIRRPDSSVPNLRTRVALFSFLYELEVNKPDSSGGIILRIPINANVS